MNRSILIVICDFLLVSLLAFSTVDINKVTDHSVSRQADITTMATNQPENGKDLAAVMKVALEDEHKHRDLLMNELTRARATTEERDKQTANLQQELTLAEQQARRMQEQQTNLKQQQSELQQQYQAAQTNVQSLSEKLQNSSQESVVSKEKLAALEAEKARMEAEKAKLAEEAVRLQQQVSQLARSNELAAAEKMRLNGELKVAMVEKNAATEKATMMTEQVKVERAEKAKLAEGVKALATKSSELTQEIRDNRPLAPNTIFNDFLTNRVEADIIASRAGFFSENNKRKTSETVLVSDGSNTFALCHVEDTPLTLWVPGTDWEKLAGTLMHGTAHVPIHSLAFHSQDPRVVLMPISEVEAQILGSKIYRLSPDPYKFQDAVLVGTTDSYYGECKFEIDANTPGYVKLDRNLLKGLFGKFNPSRGDLMFSKTGELLGVMANSSYCLMLRSFDADTAFQFGADVGSQHTGNVLSQYYTKLTQMPSKLQ